MAVESHEINLERRGELGAKVQSFRVRDRSFVHAGRPEERIGLIVSMLVQSFDASSECPKGSLA